MTEARVPALAEFGKVAKDLLYGSRGSGVFQFDQRVQVSTKTSNGLTLGGSVVRSSAAPDKVDANVLVGLSGPSFMLDGILGTDGSVNVSGSLLELVPGLKLVAAVKLPDFSAPTSLTVEYAREQFNVRTMLGMTPSPVMGVAASVGHQGLLVGGDASYDTGKSAIGTWNLGLGYHTEDYQTALFLADQGQRVKATYGHVIGVRDIAGLEVDHLLGNSKSAPEDTSISVGYARLFDSGAMGKARLETSGALSFLYEQSLKEGGKVALTTQVNVRDINQPPKLGFSFSLG